MELEKTTMMTAIERGGVESAGATVATTAVITVGAANILVMMTVTVAATIAIVMAAIKRGLVGTGIAAMIASVGGATGTTAAAGEQTIMTTSHLPPLAVATVMKGGGEIKGRIATLLAHLVVGREATREAVAAVLGTETGGVGPAAIATEEDTIEAGAGLGTAQVAHHLLTAIESVLLILLGAYGIAQAGVTWHLSLLIAHTIETAGAADRAAVTGEIAAEAAATAGNALVITTAGETRVLHLLATTVTVKVGLIGTAFTTGVSE